MKTDSANPRRPWLALLLGLFFPGLGHFYAGAPVSAAVAFVLFFFLVIPVIALVQAWLSWSPVAVVAGLALSLLFALVVPIDGARVAKRRRLEPIRPWNRLLVYAAFAGFSVLVSWHITGFWAEYSWIRKFRVPSGAMEDTLMIGDIVLADMRSGGLFPIRRGDIAVFEFPPDPSNFYLKRVVGLPGEELEMYEGQVYIDGVPLDESYVADAYREKENYGPTRIPDNHYFVLGDHRNRSSDSRDWGTVASDAMRGKAYRIYWSHGERVRWERIGMDLRPEERF